MVIYHTDTSANITSYKHSIANVSIDTISLITVEHYETY